MPIVSAGRRRYVTVSSWPILPHLELLTWHAWASGLSRFAQVKFTSSYHWFKSNRMSTGMKF